MIIAPSIIVGIYLGIALIWWGICSGDARRMLRIARDLQREIDDGGYRDSEWNRERRDRALAHARDAAADAPRAPYWLPWLNLQAARSLQAHNRELASIRTLTTDLDQIQRADRLKQLEAEVEKLRREQES